jgi:hypothetical protein
LNRNSAILWLPAIEAAGLPVPKTITVPYKHHDCLSIFDGERSEEFERLSTEIMAAAQKIGFPVFIRTDLSSAKHSGPSAYKIEVDGQNQPIAETLGDNELKFWLEREGPTAFLVRQFIELDAPFTAFHGLPIAREFRFFANEDHVFCWHPYWPPTSIEEYRPSCEDWRDKLAELQTEPAEISELKALAMKAAGACGRDEWSVDFFRDVNGKWWLSDMAVAKDSYHWESCERAVQPA